MFFFIGKKKGKVTQETLQGKDNLESKTGYGV